MSKVAYLFCLQLDVLLRTHIKQLKQHLSLHASVRYWLTPVVNAYLCFVPTSRKGEYVGRRLLLSLV